MTFDSWENTLCHYGIKGQKWGILRYQNPDGSLTPEGRKRYLKNGGEKDELNIRGRLATSRLSKSLSSSKKQAAKLLREKYGSAKNEKTQSSNSAESFGNKVGLKTAANKTARGMTTEELTKAIQKLRLEREYSQLYTEQNRGIISTGAKIVSDAIKSAASQTLTSALTNAFGSGINYLAGRKVVNQEMGKVPTALENYTKTLKADLDRVTLENAYSSALEKKKQIAEKEKADAEKAAQAAKAKEPKIVNLGPKIQKASDQKNSAKFNPRSEQTSKAHDEAIKIASQVIEENTAIEKLKKKGYRFGSFANR